MIPKFEEYYPSELSMNDEQRSFYKSLEHDLIKGNFPDVSGNISYLFVYVYKLIFNWDRNGFENLYDYLLELSEAYFHEKKFSEGCKFWSYDCLLALEKYDKYLELTQINSSEDIFKTATHAHNVRCNVFWLLGKSPQPEDLIKMSNFNPTKFTLKHSELFKNCLDIIFDQIEKEEGSWLNRFFVSKINAKQYEHYLFSGVPFHMSYQKDSLKFKTYAFYSSSSFLNLIKNAARQAENKLREIKGIPKIGEGWISETELYHAIREAFPQTKVVHHGYPSWLGRQHLDIWLPRWKIAVEYQGKQHFEPVDFFGGEDGYKRTVERDETKKLLCEANNVRLIEATENTSHRHIIEKIFKLRKERLKKFVFQKN